MRTYRERWKQLALSTGSIDRDKAKQAIKTAYRLISTNNPDVASCWNPDVEPELLTLTVEIWNDLRLDLSRQLRDQLTPSVWATLVSQLTDALRQDLAPTRSALFDVWDRIWRWQSPNNRPISDMMSVWALEGVVLDFCISALNCTHNPQKWEVFQELSHCCGWIIPTEEGYRVCDRAYQLRVDADNLPHAIGEPALEFDNGFGLYAYHGVPLPAKYGQVHPSQWRPEWILEERNAELRRILMHEIGAARMYEELQTVEIDRWQDYSLLQVNNLSSQKEPVLLLKMQCPSTGHLHILRVPPSQKTARAAIQWVNHGIDPEEFGVQT